MKITNKFKYYDHLRRIARCKISRSRLLLHLSWIGALTLLSIAATTSAVTLQPGDLDPTFGNGGKLTDVSSYGSNQAGAVAIQVDGKIVAAGSRSNGSNYDFALVRYNTNGSLDASFGNGGKVVTDVGAGVTDHANSIAIQSDGKIVAAGTTGEYPNGAFALVRYNTNGSLDTTFDGDGIVTTPIGGEESVALSVAIQSDSKIVVAGSYSYNCYPGEGCSNIYFAIARYNTDGSLDNSFDGDGSVTTNVGNYAFSVAIQLDGKIVLAGEGNNGSNADIVIARYNTDGSPDTSFDGDGEVLTSIGQDEGAISVAIQPDGKIVAAGVTSQYPTGSFALVRYNTNGSLDTTFDTEGIVTTSIGPSYANASSVAIQPDKKIVAAGYSDNGSNDFALARYNTDGSLDTTFGGGDGITTVDFNNSNDKIRGMALDEQGRAVVVGSSDGDFAIARFLLGPASNTITVTNTNDSGAGSLRQAIADATPGSTINFDTTVFATPRTITLTSGQLVIDKNLTIHGPGANLLSISGNHASTVFYINVEVTATLDGITIKDGNQWGGGIKNSGTLTLNNSIVSGNNAPDPVGQGAYGGGIWNSGNLTVTNSTISNNHSDIYGGGIYNTGSLTIINSTISNNTANRGGGILTVGGPTTISNSTIASNTGGGIWSIPEAPTTTETLKNTIVAGNGSDIGITIETASHNLIGDAGSSGGIQNGVNGNIVGVNPLLGPLANNGGPTMTDALLAGSPAINAGDNSLAVDPNNQALQYDQRGAGFARIRNTTVDIGAFEVQTDADPTSPNMGTSPASLTFPATILGDTSPTQDVTVSNTGTADLNYTAAVTTGAGSYVITSSSVGTVSPGGSAIVKVAFKPTTIGNHPGTLTISGNDPANPSDTISLSGSGLPPSANTITVTNTNDSGAGSLRQAIADATPGSTINFDPAVFASPQTITLTSGQLEINKDLTIQGPGANLLSISGNHSTGAFYIRDNHSVVLSGMTIRDGFSSVGDGAGINNNGAHLTVMSCNISYNLVENDGVGGGISNAGALTVSNSTISHNSAFGSFNSGGGGISNFGSGTVTVDNSTVSDNSTSHYGGGIWNTGTLTVSNSTISGNTTNSILGGTGGGISADSNETLRNTIISGNTANGTPNNISGTIETASHNLIGDAGSSGGIVNGVNGNIVGVNPMLGPLANNGGATMTHALLLGSPAINAGDNCVLTENGCGYTHPALTTDQRGMPRNGNVDIGAFERQANDVSGKSTSFDFDGDGKADVSVWRPGSGEWWVSRSGDGGYSGQVWGVSSDVPVPADYDGDGKADVAVWRPSTGEWWVLRSSDGTYTGRVWGVETDVPIPADYDGDGKTDIAVWRPSTGEWWVLRSSDGSHTGQVWGIATDKPIPADYDGDGKTDIAVWRPSTGEWWVLRSSDGTYTGQVWGVETDKPVNGDFDGDGKTDIAVWRPATGEWWILRSSDGTYTGQVWGVDTDIPIPADYDGDGKTDIAAFVPSTGDWWAVRSSDGTFINQVWGVSTDVPIPMVR